MSNNKKLALITFVSLQSAFMLAPGANPTSWSPGPKNAPNRRLVRHHDATNADQARTEAPDLGLSDGVRQALVNHANGHAVHAQAVADEAADHAAAMQLVANQAKTAQEAAEQKNAKLAQAIVTVQEYVKRPSPKNGTLKDGYAEYKNAARFIKACAQDDIQQALGALEEAYAALDMLPKLTVEARTVDVELHMAINSLKAILEKKLV